MLELFYALVAKLFFFTGAFDGSSYPKPLSREDEEMYLKRVKERLMIPGATSPPPFLINLQSL